MLNFPHSGNTKRGNIIYSLSLNEADAFRNEISFEQTNISNKVREVAFILRKEIMEAEKTDLPQNLRLEDLMSGEVQIPDILLQFMTLLITGPDKRRGYTPSKQRRSKVICQDIICATTAGNKKPSKHLILGMAMKSLTGSSKVIDILNRYPSAIVWSKKWKLS